MKFDVSILDFIRARKSMEEQARSVSRNLFGPINSEENRLFVEQQLQLQKERMKNKYNFDFDEEKPLPGKFEWERVNSDDRIVPDHIHLATAPTSNGSSFASSTCENRVEECLQNQQVLLDSVSVENERSTNESSRIQPSHSVDSVNTEVGLNVTENGGLRSSRKRLRQSLLTEHYVKRKKESPLSDKHDSD